MAPAAAQAAAGAPPRLLLLAFLPRVVVAAAVRTLPHLPPGPAGAVPVPRQSQPVGTVAMPHCWHWLLGRAAEVCPGRTLATPRHPQTYRSLQRARGVGSGPGVRSGRSCHAAGNFSTCEHEMSPRTASRGNAQWWLHPVPPTLGAQVSCTYLSARRKALRRRLARRGTGPLNWSPHQRRMCSGGSASTRTPCGDRPLPQCV